MSNLDPENPQEAVETNRDEEEVQLRVLPDDQIVRSNSFWRRGLTSKLSSAPPPIIIHGWILSFSHYIALYSTLISRLGTRCDCRKLRAKSEEVRRRNMYYARKCQEVLLPIVESVKVSLLRPPSASRNIYSSYRRGSRKSNLEDYYHLFFLHCTCLEFFISQLLRTAQLFQCFSLNIGSPLTSSFVAPPHNFIYSGLAEVEKPMKKKSQPRNGRNRDDQNTFANDSLSGIELDLASRTSCGQSGEHDNYSNDHKPNSSSMSAAIQEPQPSSSSRRNKTFSLFYHKNVPTCTPQSGSKLRSLKKFSPPPSSSSYGEQKKRIAETDSECFEKLMDDIQALHGMIGEIEATVPIHPFRRRRKQSSHNNTNPDDTYGDFEYFNEMDEDLDNQSDEEEIRVVQEIQRIPFHSQFWFTNSKLLRLRRLWQNVRLMKTMRKKRMGRGSPGYEEKTRDDDQTILNKRIRRRQYICLSCIVAISIGLFGSALGSCIYLLA
ncbi:unnamed protein product [Rodentolepis nana]|uniref:Uncharacterized protein n=1 Tax=Rodentolepis nana TaxID=102285 RepID=A0A0R3TGA4_RODNA|nr:unnamed protein product [Rodentolepis nana]